MKKKVRRWTPIAETNFTLVSFSTCLFFFVLFICLYCLICFLILPFILHFNFFFFHFTCIPNNTLLVVFYFLFRLCISYHTIVIPNPTQHPSLVLIHFTIFLSFITAVVKFTFSYTMPSFYPLLSLFLLHLILHMQSSFLSLLTFFFPLNKSLISFPPFINSG